MMKLIGGLQNAQMKGCYSGFMLIKIVSCLFSTDVQNGNFVRVPKNVRSKKQRVL
jgi:hypothetical protein